MLIGNANAKYKLRSAYHEIMVQLLMTLSISQFYFVLFFILPALRTVDLKTVPELAGLKLRNFKGSSQNAQKASKIR